MSYLEAVGNQSMCETNGVMFWSPPFLPRGDVEAPVTCRNRSDTLRSMWRTKAMLDHIGPLKSQHLLQVKE